MMMLIMAMCDNDGDVDYINDDVVVDDDDVDGDNDDDVDGDNDDVVVDDI